jgi:hypothetical protein
VAKYKQVVRGREGTDCPVIRRHDTPENASIFKNNNTLFRALITQLVFLISKTKTLLKEFTDRFSSVWKELLN